LANKVTERGLHVIKQWERFRATPYHDGGTVKSIGFGHSNILAIPAFDETSVWTLEYASEVLEQIDLPYFGKLLEPHIKIDIPDEIYSICISLSMNKGAGRLVRSDEWKILHDGGEYHLERFCESILKYAIHAPNKITGEMEEKRGLRWRRIAEAGLYLQDRFPNYL
jgi:GH24 family phage-related lysozyme (muramidase)